MLIRMSGSIPRTADTISSTIEVMVSVLERTHWSAALAAIQAAASCVSSADRSRSAPILSAKRRMQWKQ